MYTILYKIQHFIIFISVYENYIQFEKFFYKRWRLFVKVYVSSWYWNDQAVSLMTSRPWESRFVGKKKKILCFLVWTSMQTALLVSITASTILSVFLEKKLYYLTLNDNCSVLKNFRSKNSSFMVSNLKK